MKRIHENKYTIYLQSYRKYKFWFNFYYLFLFFVFLFLPLRIDDLKLIADYQEIKEGSLNAKAIDTLITRLKLNELQLDELEFVTLSTLNNKLIEIIDKRIKSEFTTLYKYPKRGKRFDPKNRQTKEYFKMRRDLLVKYSKINTKEKRQD